MSEGLPYGWYIEGAEDPDYARSIKEAEAEEGVITRQQLLHAIKTELARRDVVGDGEDDILNVADAR